MDRTEALALAAQYGLEQEVVFLHDSKDLSWEEALSEWDII